MTTSSELVRRLLDDDPQDWHDKLKELYEWTGSAFLAGEKVPNSKELRGQLYRFLCSLIGYLQHGEQMAMTAAQAAALLSTQDKMREALRKLANEVGALKAFEPEVRDVIGNTNWAILMQRLDEADSLHPSPNRSDG